VEFAENNALLSNFAVSYMLFIIFKIKIIMKEESGFLITYSPLRPLRLYLRFKRREIIIEYSYSG